MTKPATRLRMLVICLFPYGVAAGQRLKYEQYFEDWRTIGYEIELSNYMDMAMWRCAYVHGHYLQKVLGVMRGHIRRIRDLFRVSRYDAIYIFMWVTPFGTSFMERLVRKLAKRLIYDIEDNVLSEQMVLPRGYSPNALVTWLKGPGKFKFLIRTADHVITSSPFLNNLCLKSNENHACTYISSSVDTERFLPVIKLRNTNQPIIIGWTGTFSSKIYLDMLRDVFLALAKRIKFKLKIISNFDYFLPGIELEVVRWTKENEVEDLQTFDIGVYPLPMDDWVLGKSGLKAIQYMAVGLPIVATNIGTTPLLITNEVNGLLVKSNDEWVNALERLVRDAELRHRLGGSARMDAVKKYSTKATANSYRKVLNHVIESIQ